MELHRMGHRDTFTRICLVSIGARSIERERGKGEGPLSGRRGGERLFAYPGDPPLLGNQRGDTVTVRDGLSCNVALSSATRRNARP